MCSIFFFAIHIRDYFPISGLHFLGFFKSEADGVDLKHVYFASSPGLGTTVTLVRSRGTLRWVLEVAFVFEGFGN